MEDIVEVPKDVFDKMIRVVALMDALWAAGVDNWEGYDEAFASVQETANG